MYSALIITLLLWKHGVVESIRILDLRVPGHAAEGGQALLGCQFDLEGDDLYSVKWYKGGREFYRYVPSNSESTTYFYVPGVFVDISRSSSTVVTLEHITQDSGGRYRCEVSGEAPYFVTVSDDKDISIHLLPNHAPKMIGLKNELRVGDLLVVNCTSPRSRPKAQIKWLINDLPAPKNYIRGPWDKTSRERSDARDTILELSFIVRQNHFHEGVLTLKCQASLAPLYQEEVIHHILQVTEPTQIDNSYSALNDYEETVFKENTDFLPAAESQSDRDIQGSFISYKKAASKLSPWAILPSIIFLRIFI
ncbi:uncharacterized protein LOC113403854 isoform X1 [Vanessa tameamea]|uniref:Uncharacterized protein LOC113403854 isoform X1 n=1 Tax=Vanessa tameamea TaxID=334116 RepID=A0A8B8ISY6_VANTA|nr:uncharacterized protein LOC113403854 isoform X1 [Vanessa tameamea]